MPGHGKVQAMPTVLPAARHPDRATSMAAQADQAAALLKALAHPARLRVLCRLVEGEASVGDLQPLSGLGLSALSQHLAVLRGMALVTTRREAQTIFYALAESPALGVLAALHAAYCPDEQADAV
jgi:DNA-binding transcriptional ArsR family regulator